ncbi:hypothetical protein N0303_20800, partial [Acinetobacter baumannii]|nr:hypothetical protein [Acinetobacter baumannii]
HEQGVLFIGPAEGSLLARMGMRPVGIAQSFAYVRQAEREPAPPSKPLAIPLPLTVPVTAASVPRPAPVMVRKIKPIAPPSAKPAAQESAGQLLAQI